MTIGIAILSLVISGFALYFTQLRGASISVQLLSHPDTWSLQFMKEIDGGQQSVQASVSDAPHCQVSGSTNALVSNDGPKGGAIWAVETTLTNLPAPCITVQRLGLNPVLTLAGNTSVPSTFDFIFRWPIEDALLVFTALKSLPQSISLAVSYYHHAFLGRARKATSKVTVVRADMWSALLDHSRISHFDIAQIAARPELDQIFDQAFRKFDLCDEERQALWQGLWMAIQEPQSALDYPVDDVTGRIRLLFRTGYPTGSVHADGSRTTLDMITQEHRELVLAATDVLVKVRRSLGLGG